jgi:hypothetical protein
MFQDISRCFKVGFSVGKGHGVKLGGSWCWLFDSMEKVFKSHTGMESEDLRKKWEKSVSSGIFCEFWDDKAAAWQSHNMVSGVSGLASVYRGRGCALGLSLGLQDKNAKAFFL